MEINNKINAVNAYKTNIFENTRLSKRKTAEVQKNTDKLVLSTNSGPTVESIKEHIAQKIDASASAERLSALSKLIKNGEYSINAETLAKSILE